MSEVAVDVENDVIMGASAFDGKMGKSDEEKEREAKRLMGWSPRIRRVVIVLAALEQGATYLAQIAFLGATVVLLGGYAPRLKLYDFKLISALLLSEGVRVFLASQNVEYTRATGVPFVGNWGPGICTWPWLIMTFCSTETAKRKLIIPIFQALQVGSATVTLAFSLSRLKSGNYKPTLSSPSDAGELANFVYGIRLFYILTLVESSVFLVVKVLAWDLLLISIKNDDALVKFAMQIYGVFLREGFGKAAATNFFTFVINGILENKDDNGAMLDIVLWQRPEEAETTKSIKCLIRLTAPEQPKEVRQSANQFLVSVVLREVEGAPTARGQPGKGKFSLRQLIANNVSTGEGMKNVLLAVAEFGRIPLEDMDVGVIGFLYYIVRDAPLGFLPVEVVSKQASTFLVRSIFEGHEFVKNHAALIFLEWWSIPKVYREYGFDPADIFYRLYTEVRVGKGLDLSNFEAGSFEYDEIAKPIRTAFSEVTRVVITPARSDTMNKFLYRVDFSKLKNKQSTVNLSGIVAEVIGAESELDDQVVGLVAAWIWFMDESTFKKVISNLTKEELGMLKKNTLIYSTILSSKNDLSKVSDPVNWSESK